MNLSKTENSDLDIGVKLESQESIESYTYINEHGIECDQDLNYRQNVLKEYKIK